MGNATHAPSVAFTWAEEDFGALKRSCDPDPATPYILRYMPRQGRVIEAGCGLGRFVAYLCEMGYEVEGIEINPETVHVVNRRQPSLQIREGDVASMPYPDNSVAGVISLGVVEHFIDGPELPLREIQRILRPGAYAVLTVPSLNHIRRLKRACGYYALRASLSRISLVRSMLGKEPLEEQPRESNLQVHATLGFRRIL